MGLEWKRRQSVDTGAPSDLVRSCITFVVLASCGPEGDPTDPDALVIAVSAGDAVELVSVDGSQRRSIGPAIPVERPQWTSDGSALLFDAPEDRVFVHDIDADDVHPVTNDPRPLQAFVLDATGERLAVTHGERDEEGVAAIDLRSGAVHEITPAGSRDRRPRWSPRGDRLLFHRVFSEWIAEPTMVMVVDVGPLEPGEAVRLTDRSQDDLESEWAAWSYDARWLLIGDGHPQYTARVVAISETSEDVVVEDRLVAALWLSPTDNHAFVVLEKEDPSPFWSFEEFVIDLDTQARIDFADDHSAPLWKAVAWSPTRLELAYAVEVHGPDGFELFLRLLDLETGQATDLGAFGDYTSMGVDFSPDGDLIALGLFDFELDPVSELVVVDRETGHAERIAESDAAFTSVAWRPQRVAR